MQNINIESVQFTTYICAIYLHSQRTISDVSVYDIFIQKACYFVVKPQPCQPETLL